MKYLKTLTPQKKQVVLASALSAVGASIFVLMMVQIGSDEGSKPLLKEKETLRETNIRAAGRQINPQEIWVDRVESENKLLAKKVDQLELLLEGRLKALEENPRVMGSMGEEVPALAAARHETKQPVEPVAFSMPDQNFQAALGGSISQESFQAPFHGMNYNEGLEVKAHKRLTKVQLALTPKPVETQKKAKIKTTENRVPAGSFAGALLLSGVDASTSIQASADPRPVLMKITDSGTLPRRFKMELDGCHVTGAAVGDLSSERVFVRLEKLTCTERQTGEIIETQVAGYVAGEDGKAGVRGTVADKSPQMMQNAFFSGFLNGASSFLGAQETKAAFPVSPFGQTNALSGKEMLTGSAAQGAGKAMDRMSEFYIKRAEQLQPVIQVSAGRQVDIIFTEGTDLGETRVRETLEKVRDEQRDQAVQKLGLSEQNKNYLPSL